MDDIRPPRPVQRPVPTPTPTPAPIPQSPTPPIVPPAPSFKPQPIASTSGFEGSSPTPPAKQSKKKLWLIILLSVVGLLLAVAVGGWLWFQSQLSPVDSGNTTKFPVTIVAASSPTQIAETLQEVGVIKSEFAFLWFTRLEGVQNKLQAGTYRLSPSESTQDIVKHLTNGNVDTFSVTFLPGATLAQNRKALIDSGYTAEEVDAALSATYTSPLFATKPATADLEGYIYGETYSFGAGATVKEILEHTFEIYYEVVKNNNLVSAFEKQGLTLYEGITLASIVQREAIGGDEGQIAQVFYSRLAIGMPLGSDVTYQYIADKTGVDRDVNLDSPYNTRRYAGLPPGPIATPGIAALRAVAQPAFGDYLYFLSGDDDITYYGRTLAEHEANIVAHCKVKCQII